MLSKKSEYDVISLRYFHCISLCCIKCLMLLVGVESLRGNIWIHPEQRHCAWRTVFSPEVWHLLALWPLADCFTSRSLSSLTYKTEMIVFPVGVVRTEWDNVDSALCVVLGISSVLVTLYWKVFVLLNLRGILKCIYFCYFKEIRNESHDYPHRVAKFPENRNRNRYRDVSPCKYFGFVCMCIFVGLF